MAYLTESDINDLITSTRSDTALEGKMTDAASRLTKYHGKRLLSKEKMEMQSGDKVKGGLLYNHSFASKMVGLHEVIEPDIPDVLTQFETPWRHLNTNHSYERREFLMNRGKDQIYNMIKARENAADISCLELVESEFWGKPAGSTDEISLYGVDYWVVGATVASEGGFNGGNPSGFASGAGNIDSTSAKGARWKNFNATYSEINEDDLLRRMRKSYRLTDFVSPVDIDDYKRDGTGKDCRIYMNEKTIDACETEMRSRNDQHSSLTDFMGATSFKKRPLEYVPKLDSDSTDPVYLLNLAYFCFVVLKGDAFYKHPPKNTANQPNTFVVHTDLTCNTLCTSRRHQTKINRLAA